MHRSLTNLGRLAAVLALGSAALVAQGTQTGNITGTVNDESRQPVAGATVRLTSPSLQGARTLPTDEKGHFAARLLPPGNYTIEIVKSGYVTIKVSQQVGIDQNYQPTFTLAKSGGAVVEVIATASAAVDKTDVKTATNYQLDAVDDLPVANRTMETVALLTPGVTVGVGGRVQIRGAMTSGNLMLVDGQNVEDNAYANRGVAIIDDAVEETQVITGAISAEYGNVEGGVMNSITRSGSNTFTGQIRWELQNPAWNATVPYQTRTSLGNALGSTLTYSVGGFIVPDKLWFYTSYFTTDTTGTGQISSLSTAPERGQTYPTTTGEIRRQLKMTYQINENHTLVGSFMNMNNTQGNRNYSAGEYAALIPQKNESSLFSLSWRAIWNPTVTSELRFGSKKQVLTAGGAANGIASSPLYDYNTGLYYNNGIFDRNDGGDHRQNRTVNFKTSIYADGAGTHQIDTGIDYYKGIRQAKNGQTPTGYTFGNLGVDPVAQTVTDPQDAWTFVYGQGEADTYTYGLYVNDKWSLNKFLSFQIGLRWDKYKAENESGAQTAGATGLSPRLGLKYDIMGDSKWVAGLSWARYNGKVLEGILDKVTSQGNPTETDYAWAGGTGPIPYAQVTNLANYDTTANGITYYNNPAVNVKLAPGLKAPHIDEFQASLAYNFVDSPIGTGFVRLTTAHKDWKDIIDYSVGNNGTVEDAAGQTHYLNYWDNNPTAVRKYQDLEFDAQDTFGKWTLIGNITWSSLKGNYEGEGSSTPARGEGIRAWNVVNGVTMFDNSYTAPYGYLSGHVATRMRWTADYTTNNAFGKCSVGFIYRLDTGQHYSATRTVSRAHVNPALPTESGTNFTEYMDAERGGGGIFPTVTYLDMSITQNFEVAHVGKTPINAFVKLVMQNFLNHMQVASWNTIYASGASFAAPWVPSANYGLANTSANFGIGRTIYASCGVRF